MGPVRSSEERREKRRDYYSITAIMTSLARQSGDVEQLVSVLERDLRSAYQYLSIAEAYREAGKDDTALEWAERGIAAFPVGTDSRLRLFVARAYQRRGRHQDALRTVWLDFIDRPGLDTYMLLEEFARKDDDWEEWRGRALHHLRRASNSQPRLKRASGAAIPGAGWKRDRSLLVEIFLYEERVEDAWREAQGGGCSDTLLLKLAQAGEKTKPERSIPIYLRLAEAGIADAPGHRYDSAVRLLEHAARLKQVLGQGGKFHQYLDGLRQKYKVKRNFQKLIEERRGSLYLE